MTWEAKDEPVRDDFILYYSTTRHDPVGLSLLAYNVSLPQAQTADFEPDREGKRDSGYFLLMASPKTQLCWTSRPCPSASCWSWTAPGPWPGRRSSRPATPSPTSLQNLRPRDQFNVMTFNETNDILSPDGLLRRHAGQRQARPGLRQGH